MDLYLTATGLSTQKPAAASASLTRSSVDDDPAGASVPTSPGLAGGSSQIAWGKYTFTEDVTFTSVGVFTIYVTADTASVIDDFWVGVFKGTGTNALASGSRGFYASTSTAAPLDQNLLANGKVITFTLALVTLAGQTWKKGEELRLEISIGAVTVEGTPTDVKVLFGSEKHPSRLTGSVLKLPADAPAGRFLDSFYLTANGFTQVVPTGGAPQKRATESTFKQDPVPAAVGPASFALATTWSWANQTLTAPLTDVTSANMILWIGVGEGAQAAAWRGLRAILVLTEPGKKSIVRESDIGLRPTASQSSSGVPIPVRYALGFNLTGVSVPAGTAFELKFITWSTSDTPSKLMIWFGGKDHPSAVAFVTGAAAAPVEEVPPVVVVDSDNETDNSTTPEPTPTPETSETVDNDTSENASAADAGEDKDVESPAAVPGPGLWLGIAAVAMGFALWRRRR